MDDFSNSLKMTNKHNHVVWTQLHAFFERSQQGCAEEQSKTQRQKLLLFMLCPGTVSGGNISFGNEDRLGCVSGAQNGGH